MKVEFIALLAAKNLGAVLRHETGSLEKIVRSMDEQVFYWLFI